MSYLVPKNESIPFKRIGTLECQIDYITGGINKRIEIKTNLR